MTSTDLLTLGAGAFLAGLVDSIVGGGGLIQIPLLFGALPAAPPATLFGTNKLSAVFGTSIAAWRFGRRIAVPWRTALPAAGAAFAASFGGALTVTLIPKEILRPLVLVLLMVVTGYTLLRKDFGLADGGRTRRPRDLPLATTLGAIIGFYDGFFGPGAGSFLLFLFVRFFALDFLRASAAAKIVNAATNFAALLYFVPSGSVIWRLGLTMAVMNIGGSLLGSQLALNRGTRFVRKVFLMVAVLLIGRFGWDTFR